MQLNDRTAPLRDQSFMMQPLVDDKLCCMDAFVSLDILVLCFHCFQPLPFLIELLHSSLMGLVLTVGLFLSGKHFFAFDPYAPQPCIAISRGNT
jgi:hypothetical protein